MGPKPDELRASTERLSAFFDVDASSIVSTTLGTSRHSTPVLTNSTSPVQLVKVHTFIIQGHSKDVRISRGYLVPTFASHWGVVVGDSPKEYTLYHLVFSEGQTANDDIGKTYRGKWREVEFDHTRWKERSGTDKAIMMAEVGQTRYQHGDLIKIGNAMIDAFGDYHRVFWNCQTFAKCFLQIICGPEAGAKFDAWTLNDTANLFLCAFVVGAPLATTQKTKEANRICELLEAVGTVATPSTEDMEYLSNQAIDFLLQQASVEPENIRVLMAPVPARHQRGFFDWLADFWPWNVGRD